MAVPRNHDSVFDGKYFSGEFRWDTNYIYDLNHPIDHTLDGTTEGTGRVKLSSRQLNIGGDFHWDHMQGRVLLQIGGDATAVPRNDASPAIGQWDLADAYRYISEGYAGYHMDVQHGLNIQAGIFMSFIGLFSYYSFDNWTYQPSYVSSNTPWFFNGFRMQWFPTNKLKIRALADQRLAVVWQVQRQARPWRPDPLAAHRKPGLRLEHLCAWPGYPLHSSHTSSRRR